MAERCIHNGCKKYIFNQGVYIKHSVHRWNIVATRGKGRICLLGEEFIRRVAVSAVGLFNLSWLSADCMAHQPTGANRLCECRIHKASAAA